MCTHVLNAFAARTCWLLFSDFISLFKTLMDAKFWNPHIVTLLLLNGLLHFSYNQLSFIVLTRLSPLGHTIGNAARRFFIIMASVFYYNLTLTPFNKLGTGLFLEFIICMHTHTHTHTHLPPSSPCILLPLSINLFSDFLSIHVSV